MQGPRSTFIYLAVVFGLLVIPRALQRYRIPAPLTCFAFGIIVAGFFKPLVHDSVITYLSTLGIAALFLFAGLEVDLAELRKKLPSLAGNFAIRGLVLVVCARVAAIYLHLGWQVDCLLALALLTPSTGFILDMLPHSGLDHLEQSEVALHAVAGEVMAVFLFLVISQASSVKTLLISGGAIALLIGLLPLFFLALGKWVVPFAPGSEFSLLVMAGLICAVITESLGVYYLVGAFVAGLVARSLQKRITTLASNENLEAISLFASFFIPFYFFHNGLGVPSAALVASSLLYGFALAACMIPIRLGVVWLQSRFMQRRGHRGSLRVAIALSPTLIFTLVIAELLRENFSISPPLYGGLLVYAVIVSILPSLTLPAFAETSVDPVVVGA
ncbi:MAG TPA: cation:proton antiporter [Acidobacteriaceae bacterium]|nr:cation:proton antiporter [Acidobacteriaceae bacterium]